MIIGRAGSRKQWQTGYTCSCTCIPLNSFQICTLLSFQMLSSSLHVSKLSPKTQNKAKQQENQTYQTHDERMLNYFFKVGSLKRKYYENCLIVYHFHQQSEQIMVIPFTNLDYKSITAYFSECKLCNRITKTQPVSCKWWLLIHDIVHLKLSIQD